MCKAEDRPAASGVGMTNSSGAVVLASARAENDAVTLDADGVRRTSELWQIHGKHFDLSGFLVQHPVKDSAPSSP